MHFSGESLHFGITALNVLSRLACIVLLSGESVCNDRNKTTYNLHALVHHGPVISKEVIYSIRRNNC